ncbi:glycosyltransferase [Thiohalobacter thiocyanaticus]|uniref:Glycosyltransferase family 4 protein n=1 Tax=Thiohalobacter thiocyanaticus TaxID=585455 RepID=A0A426QM42_9GAMM|nr:glycosyltransferase [Thiohalobacter thiocyanaticus]RRQ22833.1 glycosyltransferase family 4 protein [Thiohalobacter thiocyanaticus]
MTAAPRLLVFTTLFPHPGQPGAGLFIRERMFRVAAHCPLTVVAPVPWFPLQGLIRRFRPHYRPPAPCHEVQQGIEVHHPRFLALPGIGRRFDGLMLALGSRRLLRRLDRQGRVGLIDAHFGYPDGYAAVRLGRWLNRPVTLTLRGTEPRHSRTPGLRARLLRALRGADHIISVSESLRQVAIGLGIAPERITVVGNGVDAAKFQPVDRARARRDLGLPAQAQVLVTVGGLCERKGFHRVIEQLPQLCERFPDLHYLVVGGPSAEGDWTDRLKSQAAELGLEARVHFLGSLPPERLKGVLSAADVFVLATRNEGWANVILEAMACGLPVVATDVGGNAEVVSAPELGSIVPFGDGEALRAALTAALARAWDRQAIIDYARANSWDTRVAALLGIYARVLGKAS